MQASPNSFEQDKMRPRSHELFPPWSKWDLLNIAILFLGTIAVVWRLWQPGVRNDADMLIGVYRVFALDRSVHQHVFWPRLALDIFCGHGGALFLF